MSHRVCKSASRAPRFPVLIALSRGVSMEESNIDILMPSSSSTLMRLRRSAFASSPGGRAARMACSKVESFGAETTVSAPASARISSANFNNPCLWSSVSHCLMRISSSLHRMLCFGLGLGAGLSCPTAPLFPFLTFTARGSVLVPWPVQKQTKKENQEGPVHNYG